jgi:hypothetical protein
MYQIIIPVAIAVKIAALAIGLAALSYAAVKEWIRQKAVKDGYVDLIRQALAGGHYTVIAGAFTPAGTKVAGKTWTNVKMDDALKRQFGAKNVIRIQT